MPKSTLLGSSWFRRGVRLPLGTFTQILVISLQILFELRASGNQATRTNEVGKDVDTPQSRFKEQCYDELAELAKTKGNKQM